MIRSGGPAARPLTTTTAVSPEITRHPQLRNRPRIPSSTRGSSSITAMSLPSETSMGTRATTGCSATGRTGACGTMTVKREAWQNPERQVLLARRLRKSRFDSLQQLGSWKFHDIGGQGASIKPGDIQQRVEQLVHGGHRGIDALDDPAALLRAHIAAKLRNEQAER